MNAKLRICVLALALSGLFACEQADNSGKLNITVIPKGTTHVFWKAIHAGAVRAGQELDVNVVWVGPEKEDDRVQQIALIDNQVINQMDGIVLAPIDEVAIRRPVRNAVRKNVPVVIIDSGLKDSEDVYTSFVATDNSKGGELGGRQLAEMLGGKGRVIMLRLQEGSASTEKREAGFLRAVAEFDGIEVASSEQYGGVTTASALQASENLILRFKDAKGNLTIEGIFCPNESTTYGMLQALRRHRLAGKVKFVGFDASDALVDGMEKGEIHGLVLQDPFNMGYLGVKTMVRHLKGEAVDKRIDTGVQFITPENMNQPAQQAVLFPPIEKYLGEQ